MYSTYECPPQGSDVAHGNFVAAVAQALRPNFYVELGCFLGSTFEKVEPYCVKAVAVDKEEGYREHLGARGLADMFVASDTIEYLAKLPNESIDLCFLDSSHDEEHTLREFATLTPKMAKNGVVLFHDSYPPNEEYTQPGKCGGVYRAVERLKRENAFFEFCTLPFQYGITIARKSFGKQLLWKP